MMDRREFLAVGIGASFGGMVDPRLLMSPIPYVASGSFPEAPVVATLSGPQCMSRQYCLLSQRGMVSHGCYYLDAFCIVKNPRRQNA
jgi:hypothetical protein